MNGGTVLLTHWERGATFTLCASSEREGPVDNLRSKFLKDGCISILRDDKRETFWVICRENSGCTVTCSTRGERPAFAGAPIIRN